jgi:large subunit ribosomal protein L3
MYHAPLIFEKDFGMTIGIIGRKLGMSQRFDEKGVSIPVTVIQAGPCVVVQKKTLETDQYNAIQIGFDDKKVSRLNKADKGHFEKNKITPKKFLKEIRLTDTEVNDYKVGDAVTVGILEKCKFVDVIGFSKGRGFTGVIKRHNFKTPKMTHGTHEKFRHGGSLGSRFPQHVAKGKKMAGVHGNEQVTMQNLEVHSVRKEENLIFVVGAVPGANNGIVLVRMAIKKPIAA